MGESSESLLEFPCEFAIKALGKSGEDLTDLVTGLIRKYAPEVAPQDVSSKSSSGGRYTSVTVTITARDRAQVDNIYLALNEHPRIVMTL